MPFASGTFTLVAGNPVTTATTISSSWANTTMADLALGLTTCVLKDGSQVITANLPMGGFKFTGLGAGSATGNSLRYDDVYVTALGNIPMAGLYKMTSMADGSATTDSATFGQTKVVPITAPATGYVTVLGDAGKALVHLIAVDTTARTYTIDGYANVAYVTGTVITFVNQTAVLSIALASGAMYLAGTSTTGTRSLAGNGTATAIMATPTLWYISGTGLS